MLTDDVRRESAPIGPEATCAEARLQIADGAPGIAIVDRAGRPLGLVSRAALFAAALDKPITALAEAEPLVVENDISLEAIETSLLANASALGAGFLIVSAGRYAAIGDSAAVLRARATARTEERTAQIMRIHTTLKMGDIAVWTIDYPNRQILGVEPLCAFVGRTITFEDVATAQWSFATETNDNSLTDCVTAFETARANGGNFELQHGITKDGRPNWFKHVGRIEYDEHGAVIRASIVSTNTSRGLVMVKAIEAAVDTIASVLADGAEELDRIRHQINTPPAAPLVEETPTTPHPAQTRTVWVQRVLRSLDVVLRDLRERDRLLLAAFGHAEQANMAKTQFLANISHELRTPLNAILGYSEILEEDLTAAKLDAPAQDAQRIRGAARHLLHLINGLLDLSKIEAGKMDVAAEKFDVRAAITQTLDTIHPLAQKTGNRVEVDLAADLGYAHTDSVKLNQCLLNLMTNACKFTKGGDVRLTARRERDRLIFEISDTGIGMTEAQTAQIFQPFMQADGLTTHRFGGTGLGLAITRRLVQLLGGDVSVVSAPGQGSTFTLWAPARLGSANSDAPAEDQKSHDRLLALVVDADDGVVDAARRGMSRLGFGVRSAANPAAALAIMHESRPAIVILGANTIGTADLTLLELIKNDATLSAAPVIVLAALSERERAIRLGACAHMAKPVNQDELAAAAVRYADFNPLVANTSRVSAASAA
jgi:signal transduction histidine kinase/CheY-like chemotaxis protein